MLIKKESRILLIYLLISFLYQQTQIVAPIVQYVSIFFIIILIVYNYKFIKIKHNVFVFLFVIVTSLSIFVSLDKQISIVRIITLSSTVIFLFYVVDFDRINIDKFLSYLFVISSAYIFFSYINVEHLKDYKGEFEGYIKNRYNISTLFGFYFVLSLALILKVKRLYLSFIFVIVSLINLYLIYLSHARIGFFNIIIYTLMLVSVYVYRLDFLKKLLFLLFFVFIVSVIANSLKSNEYILYAIERGTTGRGELASVLFNYMYNNPYSFFLGFGAGSLESLAPTLLYNIGPRDVNNIVGVVFEYGILGLVVFLAIFFRYFYQLYKLCKIKHINYPYLCIPVPIILSVSEVSWLNFNTFPTLMMYLFISYTSYIYTREKRVRTQSEVPI